MKTFSRKSSQNSVSGAKARTTTTTNPFITSPTATKMTKIVIRERVLKRTEEARPTEGVVVTVVVANASCDGSLNGPRK